MRWRRLRRRRVERVSFNFAVVVAPAAARKARGAAPFCRPAVPLQPPGVSAGQPRRSRMTPRREARRREPSRAIVGPGTRGGMSVVVVVVLLLVLFDEEPLLDAPDPPPLASPTLTVRSTSAVFPTSSRRCATTRCGPAVANVWVTEPPLAGAPSSKVQSTVTGESASRPAADSATGSPTVAFGGALTSVASGGVAS